MTTLICETSETSMRLAPGTAALVAPGDLVERAFGDEPVPAIVHPSGQVTWLVLLVRAATDADQPQVAALSNCHVGYLPAGHDIDLPPTTYPDGALTWRDAATADQPWPPFALVASTILNARP